jgi:tRNA G18 (ribose-2'-O)-methylase SpoU
MTISSRQNVWFKRLREAIRDHNDEIVIEGPKAVADAIAAGWSPVKVFTRGVDFTAALFDALAETRSPQNVIGLFHRPRFTIDQLFARATSIVIALDGVQDPGNVGTIVRLAAAFDAHGIVLLPGCADPFGPSSMRRSKNCSRQDGLSSLPTRAAKRSILPRGAPCSHLGAKGRASRRRLSVLREWSPFACRREWNR